MRKHLSYLLVGVACLAIGWLVRDRRDALSAAPTPPKPVRVELLQITHNTGMPTVHTFVATPAPDGTPTWKADVELHDGRTLTASGHLMPKPSP
jgi:hypothetical protein